MAVDFGSDRLFENADLTSDFSSDTMNLEGKNGYSVHLKNTGDCKGIYSLAVSNNNKDWAILPDSPVEIEGEDDVFYNVTEVKYQYAKVQWIFTSGNNGNGDAFFNVKGGR